MAGDISKRGGPAVLNSGSSRPQPTAQLEVLLQGWSRTHWMTAGMAAAAQHATSYPVDVVADALTEPVHGHRTYSAASELFPMAEPIDPASADAWSQSALAFLDQDHIALGTQSPAQGNIDESTAELLRPLLQQWVNDHLSDVVVKVLRSDSSSGTPN